MNAFLSLLEKHSSGKYLRRGSLTTLQVNLGNLCNQSCTHCHIDASPQGKNIMSKAVIDDILGFLAGYKIVTLDITGGAPELNPNFEYLIEQARPLVDEIIVRSNLTVLLEPGKADLVKLFRENKVHLIGSMPCYSKENVDRQRGEGTFDKSLKVLKLLNELGFARDKNLKLDLVYNPQGPNLPPEQTQLEKDYKRELKENYGLNFNRLITITNVPIKKFKHYLQSQGIYEKYYELLKSNFNPEVLENLMCHTFLSLGFDGKLYDCDFNQALGLNLKTKNGNFMTIDKLEPKALEGKEIIVAEHCLSCAAGSGSSCQGALTDNSSADKKKAVENYYGKVLESTKDLKTSACCSIESLPENYKQILSNIEPEILEKFYGCGSPIPPLVEGGRVLDLGCGTGRDVYLAAYLAGEDGFVVGVDMTEAQLKVAKKHIANQMQRFGFKRSNVEFKKGYIEDLAKIGIKDNSIDVVISNCVINLSPDKESVFSEIFRVLKPGGELYFSDVFAGRRIPKVLRDDPVLYGECLGGALYLEDFRRLLRKIGCRDYRVVSKRRIILSSPELAAKVGKIDFYAMTIRAFKLTALEDICEDYGQVARYLGTIPGNPHRFILDDHHTFITGKPELVCGNTAAMLSETRYQKHFAIVGDRSNHYGPFICRVVSEKVDSRESLGGGCC